MKLTKILKVLGSATEWVGKGNIGWAGAVHTGVFGVKLQKEAGRFCKKILNLNR